MSQWRRLWIEGPAGRLEAALRLAASPRATAVIAHPHPLYGGTMHNPVVFHVDRELNRAGLTTLRFNFRGAGASEGAHDDGRGEILDVGAAATWLKGLSPERPQVLVGYSFGSRCVIGHALDEPAIAAVVAIGLPVRLWSHDDLVGLARPFAVVQGSEDEFGAPEEVRAVLDRMAPQGRLHVVSGAPHTFPGRAGEVASAVREAVLEALGGAGPT